MNLEKNMENTIAKNYMRIPEENDEEISKKIEDPNILIVELEQTRSELAALNEEFIDMENPEPFLKKIDDYVDSLDQKSLEELGEEIKEKILGSTDRLKAFQEFNVDPFASDLTKRVYSHPINFETQMRFDKNKQPLIENEGTGGYYDPEKDEIIIYIPDKNNKSLQRYCVNLEDPTDLKGRIKLFLKEGFFSPLTKTIQHELTHADQGKKFLSHERRKFSHQERALKEAQAWHEMAFEYAMHGRGYGVSQQIEMLQTPEPEDIADSIHSFKNATQKEKNVFSEIMSKITGISGDAIESFLKLMESSKNSNIEDFSYGFDKDAVINGTLVVMELRALDYSEREIARLVDEYGDWNQETRRFERLKAFIEIETTKRKLVRDRGLAREDMDQLMDNYRIKRKIDFNKSLINRLKFIDEKITK